MPCTEERRLASHVSTTIKPNGRKYYYFRPPVELRPFYGNNLRLSDDRDEALAQAAALAATGIATGSNRETSKVELNAARVMLNNATGRSKKRRLLVTLTRDDIIKMLRDQGYRCAITKQPFNLDWRDGREDKRNAFAPSLDLIDNQLGYSRENCRLVLSAINYAMNEWGLEVYYKIAEAALRFRTKTE
jgi:hypothetical protein